MCIYHIDSWVNQLIVTVLNRMDLRKIFEFTTIIFKSVSVISLFKSVRSDISAKYSSALRLSSFTTIVAALHYFLMAISTVFQKEALTIIMYRYADWVITTPVLLIELLMLLGVSEDVWFVSKIVLANILMLLFGLYGEIFTGFTTRLISGILGFVPLLWIIWSIYDKMKERPEDTRETWRRTLGVIFAGVWLMYGVVFFSGSNWLRSLIYTVLDLISKGAFGAFIYGAGSYFID